jgi:hypothetical protein
MMKKLKLLCQLAQLGAKYPPHFVDLIPRFNDFTQNLRLNNLGMAFGIKY